MDEYEIKQRITELHERGLDIDEGNLIGGPFIPDGMVRIYRTSDHSVIVCECTVEEALNSVPNHY
jgi:hypothetical protein